jgi:hypothetical protein
MIDEEEVKEGGAEEGEEMPNLDDAFEEEAFDGDEELGEVAGIVEEEEDFDTDFLLEDRDGNY